MGDIRPSQNADLPTYDAAVVGGGPVGLASAIALALAGCNTALIARQEPYADNRTTALLGDSIDFLNALGVWPKCGMHSAALRSMRLVDDTGRLVRAPEVTFRSDEIGRDTFGFNIENRNLMTAFEARAGELSNLTRFGTEARSIEPDADQVTIDLVDGPPITAALVVGADGRRSSSRLAAGIEVTARDLGQSALTFNVAHSRDHQNMSTEFHTPNGPCVFVPLPGQRCSVVWVTSHAMAEQLNALSDDNLAIAAEKQAHSILGKFTIDGARHVFPLAIEQPQTFAAHRIALVGEAAHVLPPIGAQGLNMGLRDAADIAAIVTEARDVQPDAGSSLILDRYNRARTADIKSRSMAIDLANRSLLSDFIPVQTLRAAGLHVIASLGPIRRLAMREGLAPSWRNSRRQA